MFHSTDRASGRGLALLLAPLSLFYKLGAWADRKIKSLGQPAEEDIFVISVDNLSFGGTGKTPMIIRLGEELEAMNIPFAVITRGYKAKYEKTGALVDLSRHSPHHVGDEAWLLKQRFPQQTVIVGRNRRLSLSLAVQNNAAVALLDDGFQSTYIRRHLSIMLFNPDHPYYYLRHFRFLMKEEDLVLCYACSRGKKPAAAGGTYHFVFTGFSDAAGHSVDPGHSRLFGFSALGDNARFKNDLEAFNLAGFQAFPDHFAFDEHSIESVSRQAAAVGADYLVCTRKDFCKLPPLPQNTAPLIIAENSLQLDFNLKDYLYKHVKKIKT